MKKVLAFLLVTVMAISLFAGCGGTSASTGSGGSSSSSSSKTEVSIAMTADPGTMNPWATSADGFMKVKYNIYQSLFYLTKDKELQPVIAESYVQVDATTYKVTLKQNVHDSNNNKITASDVVFCMQQAKNSNQSATFKYSTDEICKATGEYEVEFYFKQQTSSAFATMMNQTIIVDQDEYQKSSDQFVNKPVGTGPYKLSNWVVGSELDFVKNENYWDTNPYKYFVQNMNKVTYKIIAEAAQRAIELETGGVDLIYDCQATDYERFASNSDFVANKVSSSRTLNIYFNCSATSKVKDVKVRQAIAYAVDSSAIAVAACEGLGTAAASIANPMTMEWRDEYEGRVLYAQDIDKAKELLSEAGYANGSLSFSIMTDENATKLAAATIIQEACKQIGVSVKIEQLESAVFQARYGDLTAWDAYMGQSAASTYTTSFMTTQIDRTGYPQNTELRSAIDDAFKSYDITTSDNVVKLWEQEIPILPLVTLKVVFIYKSGLQNAEIDINNVVHPGSFTWGN